MEPRESNFSMKNAIHKIVNEKSFITLVAKVIRIDVKDWMEAETVHVVLRKAVNDTKFERKDPVEESSSGNSRQPQPALSKKSNLIPRSYITPLCIRIYGPAAAFPYFIVS